MADTGKLIAGLSPERLKLLEQMAKKQGINLARAVILPHAPGETLFPASFAQKRLWFLDQLDPNNILYNIPLTVRLFGDVDPRALEESIRSVIQRHEILRTHFTAVEGQPFQVVSPEVSFTLRQEDLTTLPADQREPEIKHRVQQEVTVRFDLTAGPLFRALLLRIAPSEALLVISMHHIITDGWSMEVLVRELAALYPAQLASRPASLPALPIQYADFARWQQKLLESDYQGKLLGYWTERLAGCPSQLELPNDFARPAEPTTAGGMVRFDIPGVTPVEVRAACQQESATPFMLLLAAFQGFLYRMSGQDDFAVGTPVANRNRADIEPLIGFFVNTLVLRSEFPPQMTFRELLRRTRTSLLEAQDHQDLPFEMIVDALHIERTAGVSPLFQVMFVHQNEGGKELQLPGLRLVQEPVSTGTAKFDLTLILSEENGQLQGAFEYNSSLFHPDTMRRWGEHFSLLLKHALQTPDAPLSTLDILPAAERQKILVDWNSNTVPFPDQCAVQQLFEAQAQRTPDQIAVRFEDQSLTYRELDRRSNQLARYLRDKGVIPESIVGLSFEHSPDLVVAILGVLKAGGAYLPLDPAYPSDRLEFMLRDSSATLLLTSSDLLDNFKMDGVEFLCLDRDWETQITGEDNSPLEPVNHAHSLAYIIYTSGSTGQPKGTLLEHYGLNSLIYEYTRLASITAQSRVLMFSSINFDASVMVIFSVLTTGATMYLTTREVRKSPEALTRFLKENAINSTLIPPVMAAAMTDTDLPDLKSLCVGGDVCPWELVDRWAPGRDFINGYGPTEITVGSSFYTTTLNQPRTAHVPIGRPLANVQYYILDGRLQPVPVGVLGELHIGGAGLARGYLNQPDLTNDRFIPHPFRPGERLYKTGDLARFLPDGNVEFFGRVDFQVKIRGFRIELGEIESALRAYPGVSDAIMTVREDTPGDKRLVAYLVPADPDNPPLAADLRADLRGRMPEYMLPAAFVMLAAFPVSPVGKVIRKALPAPDYSHSDEPLVAPRTPQEELLLGIWSQVLGFDHISVQDNFFEIGGHSLMATQLASRIRETFGIEIPLRTLFEAPTIAGLAKYVSGSGTGEKRVPILPTSRTADSPLSFSQHRLWFVNEFERNSALYNVPLAVRLNGVLDLEKLAASLNEVLCRHEVLRSAFITVDGKARLVVLPECRIDLPVTSLEHLLPEQKEAELELRASIETQAPFDLSRTPLLRANLLRLSEQEHVLIIVMHHIVTDGWSMGILVREVAAVYSALSAGQPSPLPDLPIQYADYAVWQQQWLQSEAYQQELAYWKNQLEDIPASLDLPTDRPRPAVTTNTGASYSFSLNEALSKSIQDLSHREGATLFMTLLATFQILLSRYARQDDICVGTPIADRQQSEVENLIGFFANTLVMRSKIYGDLSFRDFLKRVRETTLNAYAHQSMPIEKLVDEIQPERDTSHSPLFQVMLVLQNTPAQSLDLPELNLTWVDIPSHQAMFEITLAVGETDHGLIAGLEYNADLFDAGTMQQFAAHWQTLLEAIVTNPDSLISQLPILSPAEKERAVAVWNQTAVDFPLDHCVHQLFEEQVQRSPDVVAVRFQNQSLTYTQLNQRANQLAHALIARGAGPEKQIGICVERSLEMIVGLLGILKSGAAYLPLDPVYPPERLEYMLRDSGAQIVVTRNGTLANISFEGLDRVDLEADWPAIASGSRLNPDAGADPHNAAYMIYTSGSTGTPKGVIVEHHNVVNHNCGVVRAFGITPADRVLQFATISFDTAIEEIFPTLISGATLVLRPEQQLSTISQFMTLVEEEQLTVLDLPTAYWHEWVNELVANPRPLPASLRLVVVGGEKALPERYQDWFQLYGSRVRWLNTYGPTEGTIIATLYSPPENGLLPDGRLPIGHPVANARAYILDQYGQPVPFGVPGELYLAGQCVARGYHNRPDLTAERFLPDPFSLEPGTRMYRTGDLARYLPDGNIEYTGRVDHQVKVRGFRVELGEIETLLRAHPSVADAVVLAREDTPGIRRLVAYLVSRGQLIPTASELRAFLKEQLPEYMLPALFITLDVLPLTPGGKVNRAALPAPDQDRPDLDTDYTAPQTHNEKILAEIWGEVLGLKQVGIHDNFFELGGDSILSIQVISRANQAGLHLQPRHLFEAQTIYQLATLTTDEPANAAEQGLVSGPVPLTPIQSWFFEQNLANPHHWNQSLLFETTVPLDRELLAQTLAHLSLHHDVLRARFNRTSAGWHQNILPDDQAVPLDWVDLAGVPSGQLSARIEEECARAQASLNITTGPLARAVYLECGSARPGRLLLTAHHLVIDAVSWRILLEDLQAVYLQLNQGLPVQLPAKTTSYQQWANGLIEYAGSPALDAELDDWLSLGQGHSWPLPVDFPGGENSEVSVETLSTMLTAEETQALLKELPAVYHTEINDALMAALVLAFSRWTGRTSLLVDLEGHGREDILPGLDLTRTTGWFTSMFPVRLDITALSSTADILLHVKETLHRIPSRGIGFGLLRYLSPDSEKRSRLAALPLPEVSFNYLGQSNSQHAPEGVIRPAAEQTRPEHAPENHRANLIDVVAVSTENGLQVRWVYSRNLHAAASIEALAGYYLDALRQMIASAAQPVSSGPTPSDFHMANLNKKQLDAIKNRLNKGKSSE